MSVRTPRIYAIYTLFKECAFNLCAAHVPATRLYSAKVYGVIKHFLYLHGVWMMEKHESAFSFATEQHQDNTQYL